MEAKFKLNNGDKVVSETTRMRGLITARADHIHGCNRYFVNPPVGDDNKMPDGHWFDEIDLIVEEKNAVRSVNSDRGGFPSSIK